MKVSESRMFYRESPFAVQTAKVFPLECFVVYGIRFGQTMPKIVIIITLFANALLKACKTTTVMKSVLFEVSMQMSLIFEVNQKPQNLVQKRKKLQSSSPVQYSSPVVQSSELRHPNNMMEFLLQMICG